MKYCLYCGCPLADDALFCRSCGKKQMDQAPGVSAGQTPAVTGAPAQEDFERQAPVYTPADSQGPAQQELAQAQSVQQAPAQAQSGYRPAPAPYAPRKKADVGKIKEIFGRVVCSAVALAAAFILFVSGFFIAIDFYEVSQVQQKIEISTDGEITINTLMMDMPIEQNVFNVFDALFFEIDEEKNKEELAEIQEQIANKTQTIMAKYQKRIAKLNAEADAGSSRAAEQLIDLYYDIVEEICSSLKNINIIKGDRLDAEIAFAEASNGNGSTSSEQLDQAYSLANDLIFRTALMALYVVFFLYLQVVSLLYICLSAIDFFRKNKKRGSGKFFLLYLFGCFGLFGAGQLTATSLNGVGIFCFVFAAVLGAVYLACRVFATYKFNNVSVLALSCRGVALAMAFTALCVLTGNIFDFGVLINKIGAVFGLYAGETDPNYFVDDLYTFTHFMGVAVPYLITYVFFIVAFAKSAGMIWKGESAKAKLVLPILLSSFTLASYITLVILPSLDSPLANVPEAFLVVFVLSLVFLGAFLFEYLFRRETAKKAQKMTPVADTNGGIG